MTEAEWRAAEPEPKQKRTVHVLDGVVQLLNANDLDRTAKRMEMDAEWLRARAAWLRSKPEGVTL